MIWSANQIKHKSFPYWCRSIYSADNIQLLFISCSKLSNVKCETKYQSSRKRCIPKIPGHVLEKNTRNHYRFFSSSFKTKYVHTFVHTIACTVVFVGPAGFVLNATCPLSFQLFQQKRWSRARFNCISTLACQGPFCVAVLTNFMVGSSLK